jgi:hypothetical protein
MRRALNRGRPFAVVEHVDSVTTETTGLEWRRPHAPVDLGYRIEVEGEPRFSLELTVDDGLVAAMPVINAIPAVCEARPGLLGPLDVPRYWARGLA